MINIGRFTEADTLFAELAKDSNLSPLQKAELKASRAQHDLSKWRRLRVGAGPENALRASEAAIKEFSEIASVGDELPEDLAIKDAQLFAEKFPVTKLADGVELPQETTEEITKMMRRPILDAFNPGASLTNTQRRALKKSHAYYVASYAYMLKNDLAGSAKRLDEAEKLLKEQNIPQEFPHWLLPAFQTLKGELALLQGDAALAKSSFENALALERNISSTSRMSGLTYFRIGEARDALGDAEGAQKDYAAGLSQIASHGGGVALSFGASYIRHLLDQPKTPENDNLLFGAIKSIQSLEAAQTLSSRAFGLLEGGRNPEQKAALDEVLRLREERKSLQEELSVKARGDASRANILRERITRNLAREEDAKKRAGDALERLERYSGEVASLAEFQASLAPDELVLAILVGDGSSFVATITKHALSVREAPLSIAEARDRVGKLKAMRTPEGSQRKTQDFAFKDAYFLYKTLLEPFSAEIGKAKLLTIIPTGPLASLPFGMLTTAPYEPPPATGSYHDYRDAPWLEKKISNGTALSISTLYELRKARLALKIAPKAFIGFGDFVATPEQSVGEIVQKSGVIAKKGSQKCPDPTVFLRSAKLLPDTRIEIEEIGRAFDEKLGAGGATKFMDQAFTDAAVKQADLSQYRILHFATHGILADKCLMTPALLTSYESTDPQSDSLLSAAEIAQLNLNADLVVMSACDTSGGDADSGESLSGLARGFFAAKARNVIGSHWAVSSAESKDLMLSFYGSMIAHPQRLAENLREAKLKTIDNAQSSHPWFWAPFDVFGDGGASIAF